MTPATISFRVYLTFFYSMGYCALMGYMMREYWRRRFELPIATRTPHLALIVGCLWTIAGGILIPMQEIQRLISYPFPCKMNNYIAGIVVIGINCYLWRMGRTLVKGANPDGFWRKKSKMLLVERNVMCIWSFNATLTYSYMIYVTEQLDALGAYWYGDGGSDNAFVDTCFITQPALVWQAMWLQMVYMIWGAFAFLLIVIVLNKERIGFKEEMMGHLVVVAVLLIQHAILWDIEQSDNIAFSGSAKNFNGSICLLYDAFGMFRFSVRQCFKKKDSIAPNGYEIREADSRRSQKGGSGGGGGMTVAASAEEQLAISGVTMLLQDEELRKRFTTLARRYMCYDSCEFLVAVTKYQDEVARNATTSDAHVLHTVYMQVVNTYIYRYSPYAVHITAAARASASEGRDYATFSGWNTSQRMKVFRTASHEVNMMMSKVILPVFLAENAKDKTYNDALEKVHTSMQLSKHVNEDRIDEEASNLTDDTDPPSGGEKDKQGRNGSGANNAAKASSNGGGEEVVGIYKKGSGSMRLPPL